MAIAPNSGLAHLLGGDYFGDFAAGDVDTCLPGVAGVGEIVGPDVDADFGIVGLGEFGAEAAADV